MQRWWWFQFGRLNKIKVWCYTQHFWGAVVNVTWDFFLRLLFPFSGPKAARMGPDPWSQRFPPLAPVPRQRSAGRLLLEGEAWLLAILGGLQDIKNEEFIMLLWSWFFLPHTLFLIKKCFYSKIRCHIPLRVFEKEEQKRPWNPRARWSRISVGLASELFHWRDRADATSPGPGCRARNTEAGLRNTCWVSGGRRACFRTSIRVYRHFLSERIVAVWFPFRWI